MRVLVWVLVGVVWVGVGGTTTCPTVHKSSAQVERRLLNEGFHRELESTVYISTGEELGACHVLLKETLPQGCYLDPSQLRFLRAFGGPDFYVPQLINVETPEHLSPRVTAYLFARPVLLDDGRWLVNVTIPVHLRYHRARSGSSFPLDVNVRLPHPSVHVLCEGEVGDACRPYLTLEPCPPTGPHVCEWLPLHSFSTSEDVVAAVPVGNTDHLDIVLLTTTCVTAGATLLLLTHLAKHRQPRP